MENLSLYNSYLQHHGILGQKWGVRRFQNKDGTLTAAGKQRTKLNKANGVDEYIKTNGNQKLSNLTGSLDEYTPLIVNAVVFLGMATTMSVIAKKKESRLRAEKLNSIEERYNNATIKNLKDLPRLKKTKSPSESMKEVNPDYPKPGSTMNCTLCTIAMSLREKGYNVRAGKEHDGMYTDDLFKKTFNSETVKFKGKNNKDTVLNTLQSQGDGAYGNLTLKWKYGGGHSIFWKNENGKTRIYDGQSGEEYKSSDGSLDKVIHSSMVKKSSYNRLDNCQPNKYVLGLIESNK